MRWFFCIVATFVGLAGLAVGFQLIGTRSAGEGQSLIAVCVQGQGMILCFLSALIPLICWTVASTGSVIERRVGNVAQILRAQQQYTPPGPPPQ